jgi:hypothetical protein
VRIRTATVITGDIRHVTHKFLHYCYTAVIAIAIIAILISPPFKVVSETEFQFTVCPRREKMLGLFLLQLCSTGVFYVIV